MQQFSSKEKYHVSNTLNCVPLLLQGHAVLVDLRNETSVAGRVDSADGFMNMHLRDAVYIDRDGLQYPFEEYMVRERLIRQIHIPAALDMEQEIRHWMEHGLRDKRPTNRSGGLKGKRTYKQKRAEERHKEILQEIQKKNESTVKSK